MPRSYVHMNSIRRSIQISRFCRACCLQFLKKILYPILSSFNFLFFSLLLAGTMSMLCCTGKYPSTHSHTHTCFHPIVSTLPDTSLPQKLTSLVICVRANDFNKFASSFFVCQFLPHIERVMLTTRLHFTSVSVHSLCDCAYQGVGRGSC